MARQQKKEDEDSLKRRARRRLIGAVALTTVVVVVVPMVLDKEPKPMDQDIELRIPDRDNAGAFNPDIKPQPTEAEAAVPAPESPPDSTANAKNDQPTAPTTDSGAATAKQEAPPSPVAQTHSPEKTATAKPVEKKTSGEPEFVVQAGAFSTDMAARDMQDKLNQKGIKSFIEKSGNVSRVRVGPFKTHEEADKFLAKLEALGFKAAVATR